MTATGPVDKGNGRPEKGREDTLSALDAERLELIGHLTDGVAHDFSNLMAAVHSGLGLLERRLPMTEESKHILGMMRHATKQGTDLVNHLLAFCNGRPAASDVIRLCDLEPKMRLLMPSLMKGSAAFEWHVELSAWPVYADANRLELALVSLVSRARDKGDCVAVSASNRSFNLSRTDLAPGDYVVIRVSNEIDRALGLDEDDGGSFFDSTDLARSPPFNNVYSFARHMNGILQVDLPHDRGWRAYLWLPRAVEAGNDDGKTAQGAPFETRR